MRRLIPALLVGLISAPAVPLHAQSPDWVSQVLAAARLPIEARDARNEGVRNDEIRAVLESMRNARVPAHEATAVLDTARAVRREHGPVDNFGAFVQAQLASGKRGRDLAAAIRAEHARQGKGNAARGDTPGAQGRGQGQAQGQAQGQGRDRGDSARGRADTARGRDDARPGRQPAKRPDDRERGKPGRPTP